jgi:hypothetical protein
MTEVITKKYSILSYITAGREAGLLQTLLEYFRLAGGFPFSIGSSVVEGLDVAGPFAGDGGEEYDSPGLVIHHLIILS